MSSMRNPTPTSPSGVRGPATRGRGDHGGRAPAPVRALCAGLLGAAAALLAACGSSGKGLIPAANAGPLQSDFEAVAQAAQSGNGNCAETTEAIDKTERDFAALPSTIDPGLRQHAQHGHLQPARTRPRRCARNRSRRRRPRARPAPPRPPAPTTTTTTTTDHADRRRALRPHRPHRRRRRRRRNGGGTVAPGSESPGGVGTGGGTGAGQRAGAGSGKRE